MKKYATEIHHALTRFYAAGFVVTSIQDGERNSRHEWAPTDHDGRSTGADIDQAVEQILAYDDSWVRFGKDGKHIAEGYVILGNKPGDLFSYTDWSFAGDTTDNAAEYEFNNLTADVPKQFRAWHAINEMPGIAGHIADAYRDERDQWKRSADNGKEVIAELKTEHDQLSSDHQAMGVELRQAHKSVNRHVARCTELEDQLEAERAQPITDAANERLLSSLKHQSTNWQSEAEAYRRAYNTLLNRIEPTVSKVRDRLTDDLRKLWNQS